MTVHVAPVYSLTGPEERKEEALLETFRQLTEPMHQLDWDKEYVFIKRALDDVWQRNGWTDEADRYARDLACEVAAIPPWQPIERLNLLNERVTERYGLTTDQANRFRNTVMGETAGFLMRIPAIAHSRSNLQLDDAQYALKIIDGNLGYAPALALGPAKLRLNHLSQFLTNFINTYCPT